MSKLPKPSRKAYLKACGSESVTMTEAVFLSNFRHAAFSEPLTSKRTKSEDFSEVKSDFAKTFWAVAD